MSKTNEASSGFTAVQVGRIVPRDDDATDEPAERPKPKPRRAGRVVNVREGDATVGKQADVIVGDVTIRMPR